MTDCALHQLEQLGNEFLRTRPTTSQNKFFHKTQTQGMFTKTDQILGHKTWPRKCKEAVVSVRG